MSKKGVTAFRPLKTLSAEQWPAEMFKPWKGSFRDYEPVLLRFIDQNKAAFDFLGIKAELVATEHQPSLRLTTSGYIGSAPIKAPDTGKPIGDLTVVGRFGENSTELLDLLAETISPEYDSTLPLVGKSPLTPPLFMECCQYIDLYIEAEHTVWQKFINERRTDHAPRGETGWTDYALRTAADPLQATTFRNRVNTLTTDHAERHAINYVLALAINIVSGHNTPIRTKTAYRTRIDRLKRMLLSRKQLPTTALRVHSSDNRIVKELKALGNTILANHSEAQSAWRLDYSQFFERYIQYLFETAARRHGATLSKNPHYDISCHRRPAWGLAYLEPDMVVDCGDESIAVDAKYKSHCFNWNNDSEELADTFRHDLHQVLAYTSIVNASPRKGQPEKAILAYPFNTLTYHNMHISGPSQKRVILLGVPMTRADLPHTIDYIYSLIS